MRIRTPLPSFDGITEWINGTFSADVAGKVLLVHFWSVTCHLCHETAPQVNEWREKYEPQGVVFLGVHQPRGPSELDIEWVKRETETLAFKQPIAVDNTHAVVKAFENQFVPAFYVFDKTGVLRHFQAGEKGFDRLLAAVDRVLAEEPAV